MCLGVRIVVINQFDFPAVLVPGRNCYHDRFWTDHVHLQGDAVQSPWLLLPPVSIVRCWFEMVLRATSDAEVQAGS